MQHWRIWTSSWGMPRLQARLQRRSQPVTSRQSLSRTTVFNLLPVLLFTAIPVNPFKNPFQSPPQHQQQQQQQQSYQNWTIPESQSPFNGFGSPLNTNGFSNGFYYNHNMANGIIQPSTFGKGDFGNPFAVSSTDWWSWWMDVNSLVRCLFYHSRRVPHQAPTTHSYETWKSPEFSCKRAERIF